MRGQINQGNNNMGKKTQQFKQFQNLGNIQTQSNKANNLPSNNNYLNKNTNFYNNNNNYRNNINLNKNTNTSGNKLMVKTNTNPNLNSPTSNTIINNAFMMIKNELNKKDEKISQLEFQLSELQKKYNSLSNNIGNNENNENQIKIPINLNKNFTFGEINPEEIKQTKPQLSPKFINRGKYGINFQKFSQNISSHNANYNSDSENFDNKRFNQKNYGLSNDSGNENSVITINSNFRIYSKGEVKMFLKEVKSRVNPVIFKEFIQNIKLLISTKDKNGIDKNIIVENVKILFGEEFKDLFIKFESIIGINNK